MKDASIKVGTNNGTDCVYVFWGPSACGKSTLISQLKKEFVDYIYIDIMEYYRKYRDSTGFVKQEDKLKAYDKLFKDLANIEKCVFLEIGISNHAINIERISREFVDRKIIHFLCILDQEICFKRAKEREKFSPRHHMPERILQGRYYKRYPDGHIETLKQYDHTHHMLHMDRDDVMVVAKEIISKI